MSGTYHEDRRLENIALFVFDGTILAVLYLLYLDIDLARSRESEKRTLWKRRINGQGDLPTFLF